MRYFYVVNLVRKRPCFINYLSYEAFSYWSSGRCGRGAKSVSLRVWNIVCRSRKKCQHDLGWVGFG